MLFKQIHLEAIKTGAVSLAFRRWKKIAAKEGSLIKTSIGLVEIVSVSSIALKNITETDARNAGFNDPADLHKMLGQKDDGKIYKIKLRYFSADPRIALRENASISPMEFGDIQAALERLDRYSKTGPWTIQVLRAIKNHPGLKAATLAVKINKQKEWLKPNIRKLKNIGLTISQERGYTLSPRGEKFLERRRTRK